MNSPRPRKMGKAGMQAIKFSLLSLIIIMVGVPLYALPATLTLPTGVRPGVKELTLEQAVQQLKDSRKTGWPLVEAARSLVADRMVYSRRNSFDSPGISFSRGYGYCLQHADALSYLLNQLGFSARVVHAFHNRFPDGKITSHAWVSVSLGAENRYIDSLFYNEETGELEFIPLSEISEVSPALKLLTYWGATAVNAHRYYFTGKDL